VIEQSERTDVIKQSLEDDALAADGLNGTLFTSPLGASIITSDIDVLDRFASSLPSPLVLAFRLSSPRKRCYDLLSGLNVCTFLSLRCLTMSLGTAYLLTPMADSHLVEISNRSSDSTSGSSMSLFSA
jgi:hypothetical protein